MHGIDLETDDIDCISKKQQNYTSRSYIHVYRTKLKTIDMNGLQVFLLYGTKMLSENYLMILSSISM